MEDQQSPRHPDDEQRVPPDTVRFETAPRPGRSQAMDEEDLRAMDKEGNIFIFVPETSVLDEAYSSTSDMSNSEPDTNR